MEFFEEAISKAKDAFDVAYKKTNDAVAIQKQKFDVASMQSKISKDYESLGRLCIEVVADGAEITDAMHALADEIRAKEADVEAAKRDILKAKGKKFCSKCGASNVSEANFCYACGADFAASDKAESEETE